MTVCLLADRFCGMDRGGEVDGRRRIGSVKAAINLFGEKISDAKYSPKKRSINYSEVCMHF